MDNNGDLGTRAHAHATIATASAIGRGHSGDHTTLLLGTEAAIREAKRNGRDASGLEQQLLILKGSTGGENAPSRDQQIKARRPALKR